MEALACPSHSWTFAMSAAFDRTLVAAVAQLPGAVKEAQLPDGGGFLCSFNALRTRQQVFLKRGQFGFV